MFNYSCKTQNDTSKTAYITLLILHVERYTRPPYQRSHAKMESNKTAKINVKNFRGSLTTVVRAQNDIGDCTLFSIHAEWSKARRRGHSALTQRTSAVYAI